MVIFDVFVTIAGVLFERSDDEFDVDLVGSQCAGELGARRAIVRGQLDAISVRRDVCAVVRAQMTPILHDATSSISSMETETPPFRPHVRRVQTGPYREPICLIDAEPASPVDGDRPTRRVQYVGKSISKLGIAVEVAKQAAKKTKKKASRAQGRAWAR